MIPLNTIAVTEPYIGDGSADTFPITFPTFEASNIIAEITGTGTGEDGEDEFFELDITTDFVLSRIGVPNQSATLTLVDAGYLTPEQIEDEVVPEPSQVWLDGGKLAENYSLVIRFNPAAFQPARLRDYGRTMPEILEKVMDRLTMCLLGLKGDVDRSIKLNALSLENGQALTGEEILQAIADLEELIEAIESGAAGLPAGGVEGDFVQRKNDPDTGLPTASEWVSGQFEGFSARFNAPISTLSLDDAIRTIFDFQYLGPQISLSASPSQSVREKGTLVSSVDLTANTTKRSEDIVEVRFYRAGVLIATDSSPSPDGSANSTYTDGTDFTDNMSFYAIVDDGTSSVTSNTVSYSYVYPYYSGAGVPGLSAAAVAALTKDVRASTSSLNKSFTSSNGDVYYFAYPASYGALTSIKDENNFETLGDWTLTTANITGLDASAVSYRIYEFNNPVIAGSTNYTFIR